MFTDQMATTVQNGQGESDGKKLLTSVEGVDLRGYKCYELDTDDPVYGNFNSSNIHYAINAMQKGMKPPTKIGLKRLQKRAMQKKDKKPKAKPLNPSSAEQLCLKSLRTKFREDMQKINKNKPQKTQQVFMQQQADKQECHKNRKAKFIRKKERQYQRRAQLIYLVKQYGKILKKIFPAERLKGFNRASCPKISRQQIKDALTEYFVMQSQVLQDQQKITKFVNKKFEKLEKRKKRNQKRRYRRMQKADESFDSQNSFEDESPSSSSSESQSQSQSQANSPRKVIKLN